MNFLERLLGKKEVSSPEIKFEDLPVWLGSRSEKTYRNISKYAASLYPDINDALSDIRKSTDELEKADPEGRFHLKMVKIGTSNRDNMVKQLKMLLENVTVPETKDIKTIRDFHDNAFHSLTVCLDNMMKSHQYAKTVFLEESKQVIADVNTLRRVLERLIEPINEKKDTINAFQDAENAITSLNNTYNDIDLERNKIAGKEEELLSLEKDIQVKQEALEKFKESDNWKQYLEHRNELERLKEKKRSASSGIDSLILPLNKGLNRLRQLSESGRYTLNPETRAGLNSCLSDRKSATVGFFIEFQKIVESDTLNLSPDKRDKMVEQTGSVISSLDESKKKYHDLVQDIKNKEHEISGMTVHQEVKNITEMIKNLKDRLETSEKELEAVKQHLAVLEDNKELKKQELQQTISIIDPGKKISFAN